MSLIDWFVVTAIALCVYMLIDAGRRLKRAREINADSEACLQRSRELAESSDQIMTMPLCEVEHAAVMLRPGQLYRFVPSWKCETCARMAIEARETYNTEALYMATTPESKVKQALCKLLDAYTPDVYYFKPAANGYGRAGIPDVIVCCNGRMIAIECKTRGKHPTPLQQRELTAIEAAGGITMVLNEDNLGAVHVVLHALTARRPT